MSRRGHQPQSSPSGPPPPGVGSSVPEGFQSPLDQRPLLDEPAVVVIEMPPAAPQTREAVERAMGYLMSEQKAHGIVANADVVVGRWGVERGDADGNDLYETVLVVGKDRLDRSQGVTLDGTRIDLDLFSAGEKSGR